jgi:hypothetical protein
VFFLPIEMLPPRQTSKAKWRKEIDAMINSARTRTEGLNRKSLHCETLTIMPTVPRSICDSGGAICFRYGLTGVGDTWS